MSLSRYLLPYEFSISPTISTLIFSISHVPHLRMISSSPNFSIQTVYTDETTSTQLLGYYL